MRTPILPSKERRAVLVTGLAGLVHLGAGAQPRETALREALDLRQAHAIGSPRLPFVLLVSVRGCPFCEFVRRSYLVPMNEEGRINAWQVKLDRPEPLRDFAGQSTSPRVWAQGMNARTTPTLLFLDGFGAALAEPLVGVVSSEFYGSVLEERLSIVRSTRNSR